MCGIAGTVYDRNFLDGFEVKAEELIKKIYQVKTDKCPTKVLLDLAWKYKSNINFLRYSKDDKERALLHEAINLIDDLAEKVKDDIPKIDKSLSYKIHNESVLNYQNLLDASWFLSVEINRWIDSIEFLSGSPIKALTNEVIILYKDITKVVNAIDNRLELRGRDSFGITITLNSDSSSTTDNDLHDVNTKYSSYHFYKKNQTNSHCFAFKTCNSIGALGENASEIKSQIKANKLLNSLINNNTISSATIMAHTRWASVGKVNIENAHPVEYVFNHIDTNSPKMSSILNGDIYNYKDLIAKAKQEGTFNIDTTTVTNDCVAIPAFFSNLREITLPNFSKISNEFSGSFIIAIAYSRNPEDLYVIKKGIQGLYLGFSYDGFMFASDVYGFVETCRYFCAVESDISFKISSSDHVCYESPCISLLNTETGNQSKISKKDLKISNITTRDIDKKDFEHFLDKEIHDTSDIVARTISNYVQPQASIKTKSIHKSIAISDEQIPDHIFESLKNNVIKKIIITGMGTCYTAAVAISMYMRSRLKLSLPFILVEPHIATEGSAFYLQSNMQDTLVIVIAQSGTTVDTNVYVQKAKERGAMSLAIANKREGDVTFIVDGTLYIGDGRDIEIAVPSTKTYTAQVILGYILTIAFSTRIVEDEEHKKLLIKDIENLRHTESIIKDSFEVLEDPSLATAIALKGCKHNSWFILRDETSNAVCAEEIRIKYSENCYQSVASLSLSEARDLCVQDSFLIIVTESNINKIKNIILQFVNSGNSLVLIGNNINTDELGKEFLSNNNLALINMPYCTEHFTFLPTIIAGQVLSYYQALGLDNRQSFFVNLKKSLNEEKDINEHWNKLTSALHSGLFNQGFSFVEFRKLNELMEKCLSEKLKTNMSLNAINTYLDYLILNSRRTIDTIKHQAKTITVGAVRNDNENLAPVEVNQVKSDNLSKHSSDQAVLDRLNNSFHYLNESIKPLQKSIFGEVLIAFDGLGESLAYNISNLITDMSNQLNFPLNIRLARHYDYQSISNSKDVFWIIVANRNSEIMTQISEKVRLNKYVHFDFNDWHVSDELADEYQLSDENGIQFKKAFWSLAIGVYLIENWMIKSFPKDKNQSIVKKINFEIVRQLNNIKNAINDICASKNIKVALDYGSDTFLSKRNWKCIGSGINFNASKYSSKRLIEELKRSCAFDVLENHKHIDISAESAILAFISNIQKKGYQEDAFSELEKLIAHNNIPIIVTNIGDERFDDLSINQNIENQVANKKIPIIKIPRVNWQYSFPLNVLITEKFIKALKQRILKNGVVSDNSIAIKSPASEVMNANIR